MIDRLWVVAVVVFAVNVPFGYWRAGARRLTVPWLLAVHVPVPFVIALRMLSGLGWRLTTVPALVGAFVVGQFVGGRVRQRLSQARRR